MFIVVNENRVCEMYEYVFLIKYFKMMQLQQFKLIYIQVVQLKKLNLVVANHFSGYIRFRKTFKIINVIIENVLKCIKIY